MPRKRIPEGVRLGWKHIHDDPTALLLDFVRRHAPISTKEIGWAMKMKGQTLRRKLYVLKKAKYLRYLQRTDRWSLTKQAEKHWTACMKETMFAEEFDMDQLYRMAGYFAKKYLKSARGEGLGHLYYDLVQEVVLHVWRARCAGKPFINAKFVSGVAWRACVNYLCHQSRVWMKKVAKSRRLDRDPVTLEKFVGPAEMAQRRELLPSEYLELCEETGLTLTELFNDETIFKAKGWSDEQDSTRAGEAGVRPGKGTQGDRRPGGLRRSAVTLEVNRAGGSKIKGRTRHR